jgi:putative heme-binding domain-containing protein
VGRLRSPNIYFRSTARRLLAERNRPAGRHLLRRLVRDRAAPRDARMQAFWALIGGGSLEPRFHLKMLRHPDPGFRAWAVRAAGEACRVTPAVRAQVACLAQDPAPDVRLQVAIAARKVEGLDALPTLLAVARRSPGDPLIPAIVWQNLLPVLNRQSARFQPLVEHMDARDLEDLSPILGRAVAYLLTRPGQDPARMVALFGALIDRGLADSPGACRVVAAVAEKIQTGEMTAAQQAALQGRARAFVRKALQDGPAHPCYREAVLLAATLRDPHGIELARALFSSARQPPEVRLKALAALVAGRDPDLPGYVARALASPPPTAPAFRGHVLGTLGRSDDPSLADAVLIAFAHLPPDLQARAVDLLVQRPAWGKQLVRAVKDDWVPAAALNANQVRQLLKGAGPDMARKVRALWGTVREGRDPAREKVVAHWKDYLRDHRGNPAAGKAAFHKVCGQCHTIYKEGADVGPDLTSAGRASYDQLLAKVFDPNQYIKAGFQAVTVTTTTGRVVTGLVTEDSPSRLVLKTQGGNLETIPRAEVESAVPSKLSLMPEGIEKLLTPREVADLFAFLTLDRPPEDPHARPIPGTPR